MRQILVLLVAVLLCGTTTFVVAANNDDSVAVDFSVRMDRDVYYFGDAPRVFVSAPAELAGREFSIAQQFDSGTIYKWNVPYRLVADGLGSFFTTTFRSLHQGDEGEQTIIVILGNITKKATYRVAGERVNPPLQCSPGLVTSQVGETVAFRATGGNGVYQWSPGLSPGDGQLGIMDGVFVSEKGSVLLLRPSPPGVGRIARRTVSVSDGSGTTAICMLEVVWK